jgi:hypothetical protein
VVAVVTELGDDLANRRPDLRGANSPYVRGQMEGCRDVLLAPWARTTGP